MGFLKQHIEKIAFFVLAAVLAGSIILTMSMRADRPNQGRVQVQTGTVVSSRDTSGYDEVLSRLLEQPYTLAAALGSFTPEQRRICINPEFPALIPVDAEICPYCGVEQTTAEVDSSGDGIPDHLKLRWGLDPQRSDDVYQSLDGTGFSVIHQYQLGHDPVDPNDYPPHINYLRVEEINERSITFQLRGVAQPAAGVYTLQLRWRYPDARDWESGFIRVGNTFGRNNEFTAEAYTESRVLEDGRYRDRSFALIRGGRHNLRLFREGERSTGQMSERAAVIGLYMGPDWQTTVRPDQTFELDNISYKVVDITSNSVVVQAVDSEEALTIRRATDTELEAAEIPEPEAGADPDGFGFPDDDLGFDPSMLPF